jgi:hypothetical protein
MVPLWGYFVVYAPLQGGDPTGHDGPDNVTPALQAAVDWLDENGGPLTAGLIVAVNNSTRNMKITLPTMAGGEGTPNGHEILLGASGGGGGGWYVGGGGSAFKQYNLVMNFENNQVGLFETAGGQVAVTGGVPGPSAAAFVEMGASEIYGFNEDIREFGGFSTSYGGGGNVACYGAAEISADQWHAGLPGQSSDLWGITLMGGGGIGTPAASINAHMSISSAHPVTVWGNELVIDLPEAVMRSIADVSRFLETGRINDDEGLLYDQRDAVRQHGP